MSTPPTQLMPCRAYEACTRHQACTARTARSRRKGSLAAGVPRGHPGVQREVHKACPPLAHPSLKVMAGTGLTLGAPCLVLTGSEASAAATLGGASGIQRCSAALRARGAERCSRYHFSAHLVAACILHTPLTHTCMSQCRTGTSATSVSVPLPTHRAVACILHISTISHCR